MISFLCVAVGGAVGSVSRYAVALAAGHLFSPFPFATFIVNAVGSFLIGLASALLLKAGTSSEIVKPLVITGFLGGFTTFSTFSLDTIKLIASHSYGTAFAYAAGSLVVSLIAVAVGMKLAS